MNMLILDEEQRNSLLEVNKENIHLHRALRPVKLSDGSYALPADVLQDDVTWGNWMDLISPLPTREVLDNEMDLSAGA